MHIFLLTPLCHQLGLVNNALRTDIVEYIRPLLNASTADGILETITHKQEGLIVEVSKQQMP